MSFLMNEGRVYHPEAHEVVVDAFLKKITDRFADPMDDNMVEFSTMRQGDRTETRLATFRNGERLDQATWSKIKQFTEELFVSENLSEQGFELQFVDVPNQNIAIIKKVTN